jgi:hypothetical protein
MAAICSLWAVSQAGVSWNDVYFNDREAAAEYAAISRNLYSAVLRALVASVNSEIDPGPNDVAA